MPPPDRFRLSPFEVATGFIFGADSLTPPLPAVPRGETVLAAVEKALRAALLSAPCVVGFSGGLDSSALLAVATRVARREGLPSPVPVTLRYPEEPETEESAWQELVIGHLGLPDWQQIEVRDEIDVVGPIAADALRRHGVVYPANSHALRLAVASASGGSYVTGVGGDDFFWPSPFPRHAELLAGTVVPTPRDLRRLGYAAAPARARLVLTRRRHPDPFPAPWLTDEGQRLAIEAWQKDRAAQPVRASGRIRWTWRMAAFQSCLASFALVEADTGVRISCPLAHPSVVAALAKTANRRVGLSRGEAMRTVFGDLLPDAVYQRKTKAYFDRVFWNRHSDAFAAQAVEELDGDEFVDSARLRAFWTGESNLPKGQAATLLQALWLRHDARSRRDAARPAEDAPHERLTASRRA